MNRKLLRNAACNWAGFAVQIISAFLLTPFVLAKLGDVRYGAWALIIGLTGYYGLLDLGFRAGLTQYLARHLAVRDMDRFNEAASTGFVALAACGLLTFVGSVAMACFAPSLFHLTPELGDEVRWALVINGSALAAQFALFPYSAVLTAAQRFDLANMIGVGTRVATVLGTVVSLEAGGGLVGISLVIGGCNLLDYGLRSVAAYRVVPELSIAPSRATSHACRSFLHFGTWNVAINASSRLISYSDELVIGLFLTTAAITPYALAVGLANHFASLFVPIAVVFFPAAADLDARGDVGSLRMLYLSGSRLLLMLALTAGMVSAYLADDFFRLWVGSRWTSSLGQSPPMLFRLLMIGTVCASAQRVGYQILLGMHRVKLLAFLLGGEAVVNLCLSVALMPRFGLVGVAIGTLIPACICQGVLQPIALGRALKISAAEYLREVCLRPIVGAMVFILPLHVLGVFVTAENWWAFLLKAAVAAVLAASCQLFVGMDSGLRIQLARGLMHRTRIIAGRAARNRVAAAADMETLDLPANRGSKITGEAI